MARLEFEHAYYGIVVQHISHNSPLVILIGSGLDANYLWVNGNWMIFNRLKCHIFQKLFHKSVHYTFSFTFNCAIVSQEIFLYHSNEEYE